MTIEVRAADERFVTRAEGRTTWHSFSFGAHYDPHNTGFGALIALNDEVLPPGTGYDEHAHAETEIVTWVVSGSLRHTDSSGASNTLGAGQVQRLSAGSGVRHAEIGVGPDTTRFVQSWLRPDEGELDPSYLVAPPIDARQRWCSLVGDGGLAVAVRGASLWVTDLPDGAGLELPVAPRLHVLVTTGAARLGDTLLLAGGAARLIGETGSVTATAPGTQVLVWGLP